MICSHGVNCDKGVIHAVVKMKKIGEVRSKSDQVKNGPKDAMKSDKKSKTSFWAKLKTGYNPMEEGVRWTEKYADNLEKVWKKMPVFVQKLCVVLAVVLLGSSLKGE